MNIDSSRKILCGAAAICLLSACASDDRTASRDDRRSGRIPTRDGRNSTEAPGGAVGGANGEEYRVPTGSNIPRRYNRRGYTTDNADPSFIYDQNDQRLQGANDVSDSLRTVPGVRVGGR